MRDIVRLIAAVPRSGFSLWLAALFCVGTNAPASGAAVPGAEGEDLLRTVQVMYGESRRAIRSVEYDFTYDLNGETRQARYARDGERLYIAGVWVLARGGYGMADEVGWDGQRVHHRKGYTRMNRSSDRDRFSVSTPLVETYVNLHVTWALGFEAELEPGFSVRPDQKYRFLHARTMRDEEHGACIELKFAATWKDATLISRHARRHNYAPVYYRFGTNDGAPAGEELTDVRYATIKSDGNELHYPVSMKLWGAARGGGGNTQRWRVDESTLKVNQPIPRSRFAFEPWPNEDVYDFDNQKLTPAKDPKWSPVGNVGFPFADFLATYERNRTRSQERAEAAAASGAAPVPVPFMEGLGRWLALPALAAVFGAGYFIYRQRRQQRGTVP